MREDGEVTDPEDRDEEIEPGLRAPFPYFGGKSRAADLIWSRLGAVDNYVEPFFGSGAVLLGAPRVARYETVNDADGFVANFWRALQHDPEAVTHHADNPVNENDLHARHAYLVNVRPSFVPKLEGDPDFYDAKIAGWWCWGLCCWIGSGWCSGTGPWNVDDEGKLVHLGDAGMGVNRKLVHLGDAGKGVNRKLVHLGNAGTGDGLLGWMNALAARLRFVRVCCGDWSRVCGPTPTVKLGLTGVVLDPPYANDVRTNGIYSHDDGNVAADVRAWAIEHGDDPRMRVVLCGYDNEGHDGDIPATWERVPWTAHGGYSSEGKHGDNGNKHREVLWCSPHCIHPAGSKGAQTTLGLEGKA